LPGTRRTCRLDGSEAVAHEEGAGGRLRKKGVRKKLGEKKLRVIFLRSGVREGVKGLRRVR